MNSIDKLIDILYEKYKHDRKIDELEKLSEALGVVYANIKQYYDLYHEAGGVGTEGGREALRYNFNSKIVETLDYLDDLAGNGTWELEDE